MPENRTTLIWRNHSGKVLDSKEGFDVIDCQRCGFKHLVPIPEPEDLARIYGNEYYDLVKPGYVEGNWAEREWWNLVYDDRYDTFEELLPSGRRRLLDIGCGPGLFMLRGRDRGWTTLGIEPSRQAAGFLRTLGLEVREEQFGAGSPPGLGRFDVVHLGVVLEHVADPLGMIGLVHTILDPGGLVCVVVPNDYNELQAALRQACDFPPWWVAPPYHVNYFDFESLERLLVAAGFAPVVREATFPIDLFLLMGENYVGNDAVGKECHARRKRLEHNLARAGLNQVKRKLYRALAAVGLGREVVMVARKPEEE